MRYLFSAIPDSRIPSASSAFLQHLLDTYASETNKVISVWREFSDADLAYRPHPRSSAVRQILEHQLLSERRFFAEFLGLPEVHPADVLPREQTIQGFAQRMLELAMPRLQYLAEKQVDWWIESVPFFDVTRERVWVFWRRVLHTAHHRTQLTVYLRLMNKAVPATYGPTADVTWQGADPTNTLDAAGRGFSR